ncbi:MAG: hypothetical protein RR057_01180, partial [Clostridia bacterium]
DTKPKNRFAVKFIKGTFEDLEKLEKETGHEYISAIHSYPVPTNENTCAHLFAISKYTIANELSDVAKLLNFIETKKEAANLLTYGIENVNYTLENGQVVRINQDYMTEQKYTGNAFLTYTLKGENPDKWNQLMKQNIDSTRSKEQSTTVGFGYIPQVFTSPDDKTKTYAEPNYIDLLMPIAERAYSKLINGTAVSLNLNDLNNKAAAAIVETLTKEIQEKYSNRVTLRYKNEVARNYGEGSDFYNSITEIAYESTLQT